MALIRKQNPDLTIGNKLRLKEDYKRFNGDIFTKGHVFTIVGDGERGIDVEDEDGNMISECRMITDKFENADESE